MATMTAAAHTGSAVETVRAVAFIGTRSVRDDLRPCQIEATASATASSVDSRRPRSQAAAKAE
jgi:hypothetical protein